MAQDVNQVALVARLTADPELRALASGTSVCSLRVAFNTSVKDPSGAWEDKGNFINVNIWGAQGENCSKYLSKGSKIAIQGALQWREWGGGDEPKRSEVSVRADRVQFLDSKQEGQGGQTRAPTAKADTYEEAPF